MNVKSGRGEDSALIEQERLSSFRNDIFHVIILPTEKCNFRCTYCYEDFSVGRMRPEIVQGVKRLIDQRLDGLRMLQISWFGGEPLLAADVVDDISGHVSAAARKTGVEYVGDMTTNGYLLDTGMLDRLTTVGIRKFQISLDGPEQVHDRTRVRANGSGSFHRIWQNLLTIRDSDAAVQVLLRIHLTPDNLRVMPKFLAHLRDTFLDDSRFKVFLKPVERLGGPNDACINLIDKSEQVQILARLQEIVRGSGKAASTPATPVCYAARANSLMIRANGMLGKCTVSLTDPANNLGQLRPDGTLQFNNDRLRPWLRGWETDDLGALHCPADGFTLHEPSLLQIRPLSKQRS